MGNMVLIETNLNREMGNRPYADKRLILQRSAFALTRKLAEANDEWTPQRLLNWQQQLARIAASVWRIDRLSAR
nr:HNH endonuclease family protein [uncultured Chloroflexus sp.]